MPSAVRAGNVTFIDLTNLARKTETATETETYPDISPAMFRELQRFADHAIEQKLTEAVALSTELSERMTKPQRMKLRAKLYGMLDTEASQ